jgi:hypothetical protein
MLTPDEYPNIGLCGRARVGKDTVGGILVEGWGYRRVGLADKVREFALAVDPIIGNFGARLSELVDRVGWDTAKGHPEVRRLLQRIGTEGGRNTLGSEVWLRAAPLYPEGKPVVVTDVRFQGEAEYLRECGYVIVRVARDVDTLPGNHPSESESVLIRADWTIPNIGSLEDLKADVGDMMGHMTFDCACPDSMER